jgi:metal-sulfur cluster biosynthetic enzyme
MSDPRALDDGAVREALRSVDDPEAGMNIGELGLIYGIDVQPAVAPGDMTMTTAACPMADMIVDQTRAAIAAIAPPDTAVDIELVWDPPWTPDKMSGWRASSLPGRRSRSLWPGPVQAWRCSMAEPSCACSATTPPITTNAGARTACKAANALRLSSVPVMVR